MKKKVIIVWFRKDLRVHDHLALYQAAKEGVVVPLYIWDQDVENKGWDDASLWWLHHSLLALQTNLSSLGANLIIRKGDSLEILQNVIRETTAKAVYFHERYEPSALVCSTKVKQVLHQQGIEVRSFHGNVLFEPGKIVNGKNEPYKVFTSFWKKSRHTYIRKPEKVPADISGYEHKIGSLKVDELFLLPRVHWHNKFMSYWTPGERGALFAWEDFLGKSLGHYKENRDFPFTHSTAKISPHLSWGEISPTFIWHSLLEKLEIDNQVEDVQIEAFLRQLVWRDFAYHQLVAFPMLVKNPLRLEFSQFPWEEDLDAFSKWKKGETGYPLIDAGMRELWETGWMHNRVRMVVASFLVKHLLLPWTWGANWFRETLVDLDVANNYMGWQWVTGSGFDAAPYFRIFNPNTQAEKFDGNGDYIRKWIPELAQLPTKYLFKPWDAPNTVLEKAGIKLGVTYPLPIIEHSYARKRALAAFEFIKK
ncbi:deoxyribodipyrimidine photolyase [Halalkalibacter wakoensis JCM 9140]|uniref:Deoxyribodipyrimidine photo-lyase n=1 Tax=Halalkalibacter wakoensis JCM 9140 TaxID=1236970 RepID=W4Q1M3_9BACI|nr:deoxyribodipyrimidine photo-lyase [Halalkalibacter wakoensis]GAE25951.1 deoxyribodipyrimidine photolyase [Halalkalibacter wakoensis JCM 9140]